MPSDAGTLGFEAAWALVDALVAGGCSNLVIAPGSRSTPLVLAASRHPGARVDVMLDERSAAFMALGIGKAGGVAAVITTSGTATANLLPGVVEAYQSKVPLVLLTADRPAALRDTGANQTIDQPGMYGRYALLSLELGPPGQDDAPRWAAEASAALALALGRPAGPVHLNLSFDEPLIPSGDEALPEASAPRPLAARPAPAQVGPLAAAISGRRGVILAGTLEREAPSLVTLARALGWPLIAEPASGARLPGAALAAGQCLLANEPFVSAHRPEVVLQVGATPTTRVSQRFASSAELLVLHEPGRPADPSRIASVTAAGDVEEACAALASATDPGPSGWRDRWTAADVAARVALDGVLDEQEMATELRLARDFGALAEGPLFVGSSLPVRDLDVAMAPRRVAVLANRGASGIDGSCSTLLGIASVAGRATGLIGDLTFIHDVGAFLWKAAFSQATVVVADNRGGGIFDLLPSAALPEHRELFRTPHAIALEALAHAAGATHARVVRAGELAGALAARPAVVEVTIDTEASVSQRRSVAERVRVALADLT